MVLLNRLKFMIMLFVYFFVFYDLSPPGEDGDGYGVADETQDPDQVEKNSWSFCCFFVRLITSGYMQSWKIRNVMPKGQNLQEHQQLSPNIDENNLI